MIPRLSKSIALFLFRKDIIDTERIPVCEYGLEVIISSVLGFILVFSAGVIFNELLSAMIFYGLFVIVRLFTGGYHANTHLKCKMTFLACCLTVIIPTRFLWTEISFVFHIVFLSVFLLAVVLFAPIEHINAPMTDSLKRRNRKISVVLSIALMLFCLLGYGQFPKQAIAASLTLLIIAILIIIPKIFRKETFCYEQEK